MKFLSVPEKLKLFSMAAMNVAYLSGKGIAAPPITAWRMTQRCNLTCKHCTSYLNKDKIDVKKSMELAQKIADSDTMIVILTGGEPFLMPNIKEIILLLKAKGKIVKINTNGYNLDKFTEFLLAEKVDSVTISIDGIDENMHDSIRGKRDSYNRAVEVLRELKQKRTGNKPFIAVRGVLMKENYHMMPEYINYFKQLVDEVHFQPVHDNLAHHQVVEDNMLFSAQDKELERDFGQMIKDVMQQHVEFKTPYYQHFEKFLFHPGDMEELALHSCLAIWLNFFNVAEDGTCYTCTQNIGNLHHFDTVTQVWNGKARLEFLRNIARFGRCKIPCWLNCTGVAPDLVGRGIKNLLKLGEVSEQSQLAFRQMPQYTGKPLATGVSSQLEPV